MLVVFNDNSSGVGNVIGTNVTNYAIPQTMWENQKKYIEKLEEENNNLKEELQHFKRDASC